MKISQEFFVSISLPGERKFSVKEMTNRQFTVIQKYIMNDDVQELNMYVDGLLRDNQKTPNDVDKLNFIDKIIIMFSLRIISVSNQIVVEERDCTKTFDIGMIINKIMEAIGYHRKRVILDNGLYFDIGYPKTFIFDDDQNLLDECVVGICGIDLDEIDEESKNTLMNNLPRGIYTELDSHIRKFLDELKEIYLNLFFINEPVSMDYYKSRLQMFCLQMFKDDYFQFIELQYRYFTDMGGNSEHFYNISPLELQVYIKFHNKRVKEENDRIEQEKHRSKG